jgi:hypothetical protein
LVGKIVDNKKESRTTSPAPMKPTAIPAWGLTAIKISYIVFN